jgi:hypothetical protein
LQLVIAADQEPVSRAETFGHRALGLGARDRSVMRAVKERVPEIFRLSKATGARLPPARTSLTNLDRLQRQAPT